MALCELMIGLSCVKIFVGFSLSLPLFVCATLLPSTHMESPFQLDRFSWTHLLNRAMHVKRSSLICFIPRMPSLLRSDSGFTLMLLFDAPSRLPVFLPPFPLSALTGFIPTCLLLPFEPSPFCSTVPFHCNFSLVSISFPFFGSNSYYHSP